MPTIPIRPLQLKEILLPTDFSTASKQALPHATSLARRFGARLTLAYVVPTALPAEFSHIGILLEEKLWAEKSEQSLAQYRVNEIPSDLGVETLVLNGSPPHEIVEAARRLQIDLIILSTQGHTGLKNILIGSTAERIARQAPCPVLTVREQPVPMKFPEDARCGFKRILVPTDLSTTSHKALLYAAAFAQRCGARINLLHVIEPPPYPEFGYAHVPIIEAKRKSIAVEQLAQLAAALPPEIGSDGPPIVRTGNASQEITDEASKENTDLIIVSTHGYTGLKHVLLGSTAERVVRHAACPVLVVRDKERDFVSN